MSFKVSFATAQGSRQYQEDRLVNVEIHLDGVNHGHGRLMAVMDGHGGHQTADIIAGHIQNDFEASLKSLQGEGIEAVLHKTVSLLCERTMEEMSGSSLSMVYIPEDESKAYAAVLGDSPVVVGSKDGGIHLGPEHNVRTSQRDREAALQKGAEYADGYLVVGDYALQLTRTLGDKVFKDVLNREPETCPVSLDDKDFILIGTDGLFDPGHADTRRQAGRLAGLIRHGMDAQGLVQDALRRQTRDNVTAVVMRF